MILNNFQKYQLYMQSFTSPQSYVDWGWYYLISAALQRRVFIGPAHSPLYPNLYIILVGEPGIGKGLVIKQVSEMLRYHKLPDPATKTSPTSSGNKLTDIDREAMEEIAKADYKLAQEEEGKTEEKKEKQFKTFEKPLLFPVAADATTYEALVKALSRAIRRINYEYVNENKTVMGIYTHSSLCFCLEEISSLFRKRTEDLVHFLIQAYDCGDYTYDTKTQGKDRIKKCCLNFFGGTTPSFIQTTFDDQLLTEGFSSRTFFIYAARNRKTLLWIPELTAEQQQAKKDILEHLEKLSHLYGKVSIEPETAQFLEDWWKEAQLSRPNTNIKLNPYYARKNIHVLKLAMAIHFGESTEMLIKKETFEKALSVLEEEEKRMHYALGLSNNNPLSAPARKLLKFIEASGRQTKKQLLVELWDDLPKGNTDLEEIISYLEAMGKLKTVDGQETKDGRIPIFYDVMRKQD